MQVEDSISGSWLMMILAASILLITSINLCLLSTSSPFVGSSKSNTCGFLEDKAVTNEEEFKALRLKVGFVLQHADDQLFFPQVIDDVAFGPLNQGLNEKEARKVSEEALSNLGILELKDALSYELSGGQKKLVTLACVLSMLSILCHRRFIQTFDRPSRGGRTLH